MEDCSEGESGTFKERIKLKQDKPRLGIAPLVGSTPYVWGTARTSSLHAGQRTGNGGRKVAEAGASPVSQRHSLRMLGAVRTATKKHDWNAMGHKWQIVALRTEKRRWAVYKPALQKTEIESGSSVERQCCVMYMYLCGRISGV